MENTVLDTPTDTLRAEIDDLAAEIETRKGIIADKQAERAALALDATRGDGKAIKRVRVLSDEIAAAQWSNELADIAIVEAQRQADEADKAAQDARIADILAQRDIVQSEVDALRPQIGAAVSQLVTLLGENETLSRRLYSLNTSAGRHEAAGSQERTTRSTAARFVAVALMSNTYLRAESSWDGLILRYSQETRKQLYDLFGMEQ